jgi:hypothetical protein
MALLPGTPSPNPGDRSGYAAARKHQMHGIRAVRRESGNKDPSSREAPRVFFIARRADQGCAVPPCGLSRRPAAALLDHPHMPLDVRRVGAAVHPDNVRLGGLSFLLDGLAGHRRPVFVAVVARPVVVIVHRATPGEKRQGGKRQKLHGFLRIESGRRYRSAAAVPSRNCPEDEAACAGVRSSRASNPQPL